MSKNVREQISRVRKEKGIDAQSIWRRPSVPRRTAPSASAPRRGGRRPLESEDGAASLTRDQSRSILALRAGIKEDAWGQRPSKRTSRQGKWQGTYNSSAKGLRRRANYRRRHKVALRFYYRAYHRQQRRDEIETKLKRLRARVSKP